MSSGRLPFESDSAAVEGRIDARDRAGREQAVDPRHNVVLEASAGTGKTRVLVDRYVNLLRAGVDPANILAMTFTRKAAAEMRERIVATLRLAAGRGEIPVARWRELEDRLNEVAIGTIDAFCLSLLREFPLEADLDPGFTVADEGDVPRLIDESLDRALRICRNVAQHDPHVGLVFAQLGDRRARTGLAALLTRRLAAPDILRRFLGAARPELTIESVARRTTESLLDALAANPIRRGDTPSLERPIDDRRLEGLRTFAASGPADPGFMLLVLQLETLEAACGPGSAPDPVLVRSVSAHVEEYFLTRDGSPRARLSHPKAAFPSTVHWQQHREIVVRVAPRLREVLTAYRRDLNVLVARGVWRMFRIAETEYRRTLESHALLDFSDLLATTLQLLRQMDEFARSRYRLESRYHHVLLDEFQDTSRAQWELVSLLVQSWGEGAGLTQTVPLQPSIFVVGDAKQSIYGFRDADVSVLADAARYIEGLRPDGGVRRSISRSYRAVPALLSFVNDLCEQIERTDRADAFRYEEQDRFPVEASGEPTDALGAIVCDDSHGCAEAVAEEVCRLLASSIPVRDGETGVPRAVRPGDIAILFRTRESHREFEDALERRDVPVYVYKGLGFFDADEIRDVLSVMWHLAEPLSNLRAAAWLRSGFVRLSDEGLRRLGPALAEALFSSTAPGAADTLDTQDAVAFARARVASARWRSLVDQVPPAELLDHVLNDSAYAFEMRGRRFRQACENVKKIRGFVRRVQNSGYATLSRIVAYLDRLALGDESNAAIDAANAVSLMTVHAAKGLEFPIVFVVNLTRGAGGVRPPIRLTEAGDELSVSVGEFRSPLDEDESARQREETKRLLYVALTRARDRLYLSAVATEGRVQPAAGSLGEVLPASLVAELSKSQAGASVRWHGSSARVHVFRGCVPPLTSGETLPYASSAGPKGPALHPQEFVTQAEPDFAPLNDSHEAITRGERVATPRQPLTEPRESWRLEEDRLALHDPQRVRGRIVHRLIERLGLPGHSEGPEDIVALETTAEQLIRPDERSGMADPASVVAEACQAYIKLSSRAELRSLYDGGRAFHEVPFSFEDTGGRLVRGTVDCLVWKEAGPAGSGRNAATVLEFKTGRPVAQDRDQTILYRHAVEAAFPGVSVDAWLVYPDRLEHV